jgi:hypothetical protein
MCHARDFRAFDVRSQKKAEDTHSAEARRAEVIGNLLRGADEQTKKATPEQAPLGTPLGEARIRARYSASG